MLFALAGHPRVGTRRQVTGLAMALGGEASESAGSECFDYAAWSTDLHEFMGDGPFVRPLMDRLACLDAAYEELKADNAALQAEVARLKAQLADAGSGPTGASAGGGKGFGGGEATRDPEPSEIVDPNDPKAKQQAIHKAETFAEYIAKRIAPF